MSGTPLVSPGLIAKMRTIGNRGLQTKATLVRLAQTMLDEEYIENDYGDDTPAYITIGDIDTWWKSTNTPRLDNVGNVIGSIMVFRVHMDANVEIGPGDILIKENGDVYYIQDDNHEDTYRIFTTGTARRRG